MVVCDKNMAPEVVYGIATNSYCSDFLRTWHKYMHPGVSQFTQLASEAEESPEIYVKLWLLLGFLYYAN